MGQQSDDPKVQEVMARGNNPHWKALLRDYRLTQAADRRGRGLRGRGRHRDPAGHRHPRRGRGRDLRRVGGQARPVPARRFGVPAARARSRTRRRWTSCLRARPIPALEAQQIGLIGRVVPDGAGARRSRRRSRQQVARNAPLSTMAILRAWRETEHMSDYDAMQHQDKIGWEVFASEDAQEGPKAFAEKRPPVLQGQVTARVRSRARAPRLRRASRPRSAPSSPSAVRALIDAVMTVEDVDADDCCSTSRPEVEQLADPARARPRRRARATARAATATTCRARPIVGEASPLVAAPRLGGRRRRARRQARASRRAARSARRTKARPASCTAGWIALAFDEVLGIANIAAGHPGHDRPAHRPLPPARRRCSASCGSGPWVDRVEGRRIMSRAELWDGETLTAEAEGLFVQPRPELAEQYFGPPASTERRLTDSPRRLD